MFLTVDSVVYKQLKVILLFFVTHDGDVDLIVGAERRLTAHGDEGVRRQVPDDVEAPELTTNLLHRHALKHQRSYVSYMKAAHSQDEWLNSRKPD